MFLGEMKIHGRYKNEEIFHSYFIPTFHSCVFHRLPMELIQKTEIRLEIFQGLFVWGFFPVCLDSCHSYNTDENNRVPSV